MFISVQVSIVCIQKALFILCIQYIPNSYSILQNCLDDIYLMITTLLILFFLLSFIIRYTPTERGFDTFVGKQCRHFYICTYIYIFSNFD